MIGDGRRSTRRRSSPATAGDTTRFVSGEIGQATVELALALPVVVVLLLGMLQVALVGRDQLAIELAAHEAARAAAVSADPVAAARLAAERVTPLRPLSLAVTSDATTVTVTVSHPSATDMAMVGRLIGDVELQARVTMALEPP